MQAQNKHTHFFLPSFPSLPPYSSPSLPLSLPPTFSLFLPSLPSFFHRLNPGPMRVNPVHNSATHPGSLFSSYLRSRSFCVRICSKHKPHPDSAMLVPLGCSWWKHLFTLLRHLFHLLVTLPPVTGVLGSALVTVLHNDFYSVPLATLMPWVPFMEVLRNGFSCLSRACFFKSSYFSSLLLIFHLPLVNFVRFLWRIAQEQWVLMRLI